MVEVLAGMSVAYPIPTTSNVPNSRLLVSLRLDLEINRNTGQQMVQVFYALVDYELNLRREMPVDSPMRMLRGGMGSIDS